MAENFINNPEDRCFYRFNFDTINKLLYLNYFEPESRNCVTKIYESLKSYTDDITTRPSTKNKSMNSLVPIFLNANIKNSSNAGKYIYHNKKSIYYKYKNNSLKLDAKSDF